MRIYLNVGIWLVVLTAGAIGSAAEPTKAAAKEVKPPIAGTLVTDDAQNAELRARLAKRMDIEFLETPLNQVVDFIRQTAAVQIHMKTRALEELGIGQDTPISLNLKDISVATVLELVLDDLGLDFAVDRGLVIISTPDDLQAKMVVRAYRLQSLLPDLALEQSDREAGRLAGIIAAQIAPETWGAVEVGLFPPSVGGAAPGMGGGTMGRSEPLPLRSGLTGGVPGIVQLGGSGAISIFDRVLIIRNSIKVQDEIDQFLRILGEAKAAAKQ